MGEPQGPSSQDSATRRLTGVEPKFTSLGTKDTRAEGNLDETEEKETEKGSPQKVATVFLRLSYID